VELDERFWAKVEPTGFCWNWTASKNELGYGRINRSGRTVKAHRYAYEQLVGPIPDGLELDHLCVNPSCVNPDHLEAVTYSDNSRYGDGPAARKARQTECIHGHPLDKLKPNGTRRCTICPRLRMQEKRRRMREAKAE